MEQLRLTDFEDFYSSTWREVYRTLAVVIGDADLAQEATDEAMVRTYERWAQVRRYDNPSGWVYRVALNWARTECGNCAGSITPVVDQPVEPETPADPALERALASLPVNNREVVILHFCSISPGPRSLRNSA
jgi:RNA polymerase sigma-70 factor (ECF subfamily)